MAAKAAEAKTIPEKSSPVKPVEELVEVYLPKVPGEANEKYIAINGVAWQIPRGKKWKVPMKVARMLERAEAAADTADKFSDEEQKKMAIIQGLP